MARTDYTRQTLATGGASLRSMSPKTVTAIVLVALMGILWLRVLTKGRTGPGDVQAAEALNAAAAAEAATDETVQITPVVLPVVAGCNDTLAGDFFSPDNWSDFRPPKAAPQPDPVAPDLTEQHRRLLETLAQPLHLDAVFQGVEDQGLRACIDGKVLSQGQTLTVKNDSKTYELTVSEIGEHQVVLTWQQCRVILKMAQSERVD